MQTHTFIIVGAGPAGLQAGICLQEKGADYVILERTSAVGSHFRNYPRHRQLISINKKYTGSDDTDFNLRHDWNSLLTTASQQKPFTAYSDSLYPSADTLVEYLEDVEKTHSLNIQFNTDISHISRDSNGQFKVETSSGVYLCSYLFMATGGSPWYPPIQGTEYSGIDTYENVSLDKSLFRNKKVLILGKGNSAFECAEYLSDTAAIIHLVSPRQISFAWNSRYVGDLRAVRNNFLDMYQLKSQFAILNANISRIEHIQGEKSEFEVDFDFTFTPEDPNNSIRYDKIIACTGFRYIDQEMFDQESIPFEIDRRPELKSKFPKITPEWEFSGVPRLYALGALMQTISYRKNAGGFIHGFRYTLPQGVWGRPALYRL
jgi:thioredoxin reductase